LITPYSTPPLILDSPAALCETRAASGRPTSPKGMALRAVPQSSPS
jgi:hypothetical protein